MDEGTSGKQTSTTSDEKSSIFTPKGVPSGNDSTYDINFSMSSEGKFQVESNINIKNTSEDSWNELVFYFIPNIFTDETAKQLSYSLASPGTVDIQKVKIAGKEGEYTLEQDTLKISLESELDPTAEINVGITYSLTLPEKGLRFTQEGKNYYLAQFYPMLATYRDHRWNKEDYRFRGETYHTDYSDFYITYQLPEGYVLASSSPNDSSLSENQGSLQAKNIKMFFAAILQNPYLVEKEEGQTNIRVFSFGEEKQLSQEVIEVAADALAYFEENIGHYPYEQLDIVLDGMGMEYPGIVTARSIYDSEPFEPELLKRVIVHELAHQWFYGIISNDPYHDAWLDEGFADFATGLYFYSKNNTPVEYEKMYEMLHHLEPLPVNMSLDKYESNQSAYIYGKSSTMLWKLFEERGGKEEAEKFLKTYYNYYQINTKK